MDAGWCCRQRAGTTWAVEAGEVERTGKPQRVSGRPAWHWSDVPSGRRNRGVGGGGDGAGTPGTRRVRKELGETRILETPVQLCQVPGVPSRSPLLLPLPVVRQTGPTCPAPGRGLSKVQPAFRSLRLLRLPSLLRRPSRGFFPPARLHLGRDSVPRSSRRSGGFQLRCEGPGRPRRSVMGLLLCQLLRRLFHINRVMPWPQQSTGLRSVSE